MCIIIVCITDLHVPILYKNRYNFEKSVITYFAEGSPCSIFMQVL